MVILAVVAVYFPLLPPNEPKIVLDGFERFGSMLVCAPDLELPVVALVRVPLLLVLPADELLLVVDDARP